MKVEYQATFKEYRWKEFIIFLAVAISAVSQNMDLIRLTAFVLFIYWAYLMVRKENRAFTKVIPIKRKEYEKNVKSK